MDINALVAQMPNFLGLLIACAYLWKISEKQQATISHLIDVIVKKENCDPVDETTA